MLYYNGVKVGRKKNKYFNKKCTFNGYKFSSEKEMNRYKELLLLAKLEKIHALFLQQPFILQEKFIYNGKTERSIKYVADFSYFEKENPDKLVVEDVKGFDKKTGKFRSTAEFKLKRKLLLFKYPNIDFREV